MAELIVPQTMYVCKQNVTVNLITLSWVGYQAGLDMTGGVTSTLVSEQGITSTLVSEQGKKN